MTERTGGGEAKAKVEAAQRANEEAIKALRNMSDPQARLEAAGEFSRILRTSSGEAAAVRHEAVAEIYEREKLSLAQLAEIVGTSKQRAARMVDKGRTKDGGNNAGADDGES